MGRIPQLKMADVARFDRESIAATVELLVLTFPAHESDLPDCSHVLVSVTRPVCDGDAVAAATVDGRSMTGFYHRYGNEAVIEGLTHKIRLRWNIAEEKHLLHWIFPVLSVGMSCRPGKKSPLHKTAEGLKR